LATIPHTVDGMSERLQHAAFGWPHVASGVDGRRSGGATPRNWGAVGQFALDALSCQDGACGFPV
jgi:hypothetical protein